MDLSVLALGTGACANGFLGDGKRMPPGFLIDVNDHLILFDCSEGIRHRLEAAGYDYGRVAHVAVSHGHPDHVALPQFIQAKFCRTFAGPAVLGVNELHLYLPRKLVDGFPAVWDWHQPEDEGHYWPALTPDFIPLDHGSEHRLADNVILKAFSVYHGHGRHPAMGFRLVTPFGIIAYTGDAGYTDDLIPLAQDADLLIADCSANIGQEYIGGYGHMGPHQCGLLAARANVECLWLTHYWGQDSEDEMIAETHRETGFFGFTIVAKDGESWRQKR